MRYSSNYGKTDGSLFGAAISKYDGCVLGKIKVATVGSSDRYLIGKMIGIADRFILVTNY